MKKDSFLLYLDYAEHLDLLDDHEYRQVIQAVFSYVQSGEIPTLQGAARMAFSFIKSQLDRDDRKYQGKVKKRSESGKRGSEKRWETEKDTEDDTQEDAFATNEMAKMANATFAINNMAKMANATFATNEMANIADNDNEDVNVNEDDNVNVKVTPPTPSKEPDIFAKRNFSAKMREKLTEWLKYKAERKESYKPTGLTNFLSELENKLKIYSESDVIELIGLCMANNWKGIIWEKLKGKEKAPGSATYDLEAYERDSFYDTMGGPE